MFLFLVVVCLGHTDLCTLFLQLTESAYVLNYVSWQQLSLSFVGIEFICTSNYIFCCSNHKPGFQWDCLLHTNSLHQKFLISTFCWQFFRVIKEELGADGEIIGRAGVRQASFFKMELTVVCFPSQAVLVFCHLFNPPLDFKNENRGWDNNSQMDTPSPIISKTSQNMIRKKIILTL